ncbi:MAG TPA: hypothetical protein VE401_03600 [Solirubrobacterales bacterium]|nr:hypothetical protein [Solirubrobacterales bacterium]
MRCRLHLAPWALALLAALAMLVVAAPSALAHGEEEEAAAETPARTLVQQALALLTQQENDAEAQEKLELALETEHQEDVDIPVVREALAALEKDDHELAEEHMTAALAAEATAAAEEQPAGKEAAREQGAAHEGEEVMVEEEAPEKALEHAPAFEPDRGAAEWIALGVGIGAILLALGLLAARRREALGGGR